MSDDNKVDESAIEGWTKEEKFDLMVALKNCGSHETGKIREYVTTRSFEEIEAAVFYYKQIAMKHPLFESKCKVEKTRQSRKPRMPLTGWAKLLTDSLRFNELHTETSTAVRLIADLETMPSPLCTGGVDFRQVYHQVANALEGKQLTTDLVTGAVLHRTITETALASKAFIKNTAYKYVLNEIDLSDKAINTFPRPTEDQELSVIRHLAAQRSYNPLRVSEEYLKPSCQVTWSSAQVKAD
ncbi:unnamed protein product [Chrysodeixis includens]|uniref:SANT domain-containing protein n=1 Tax=Chrysodeixis includens TaxID=689277 RepID=A0A9P0FWN8_CHRIL|nr:unnamed protein product [Chrysodeixis includens]